MLFFTHARKGRDNMQNYYAPLKNATGRMTLADHPPLFIFGFPLPSHLGVRRKSCGGETYYFWMRAPAAL